MSGTSESERLAVQFLATVYCCRAWEVAPLHPIGTCGICGQVPTTDGSNESAAASPKGPTMTDSKRAPSESEENVHRHATPVDDSPGAASEPDTTALPESTLHQRTIAPDYIVPAFDAESPTTSADPAEVDALVEKATRAASDDLFTDAYASWNYPEPWFELWCSAAAKCSGWVAWNGREFEVIADTYASGVAQVRGYLDVAEVTPVAPPLPPEPAAGSVVRAHGRLWHSKADFWHTSLGDVPKKWADLAAAPDLSPVVPVDDVCDWLDSRLVPEAVAFRAEFGGWDQ